MYADNKLYYILRAEWAEGRPIWVKVVITAQQARDYYQQRVDRQRAAVEGRRKRVACDNRRQAWPKSERASVGH